MKYAGKLQRIAVSTALMIPCLMILLMTARSAPIGGSWQTTPRAKVEPKQPWSQTFAFRGGERAAVLAIGDHNESGIRLQVAVFDGKGALVAEDKGGSELASDYVGLVWYPPRDGEYRIDVSHNGAGVNKVYIAIK
jgi:hypothetical protein